MKKSIFILSLLCLSASLFAQEDEDVKGVHPIKTSKNDKVVETTSHWSIIPHIGFNAFDGDFYAEMKHNIGMPDAGLDIEYSFTPIWNLGIGYTYSMYNITGKSDGKTVPTLLFGHMHKPHIYLSMDLANLCFPNLEHKIFSAQPMVGAGYAYYKNLKMYHDDPTEDPTHARGNTINYINDDGEVGPDKMTKYEGVFFIQAGLNIEFNLNRTLALGLRGTYSYFMNDYVDGRGYSGVRAVASKNNDGIFNVDLNLRIKLQSVKKTHVRNVENEQNWIEPEFLKKFVHDTLIIRHDSIIVRETIEREVGTATASSVIEQDNSHYYYVYFNNGKHNLDERALVTVQQVADRMNDEQDLYAVIIGYCDNTGSNNVNYALGDKRASVVEDELLAEYGIDQDHVYAAGFGKIVGHRSQGAYAPNRRAAIRLVDQDTFERLKAELEGKRSLRGTEEETETPVIRTNVTPKAKTVPLAQSARPAKTNKYTQRESETYVTDKTTTLARLARQYYNNTYCWVYIYAANSDKIKNPNELKPKTKLIIPELTQQEMNITKDESLVLYRNARQNK